ncbi:MAG: ornithine carbamoyltransferase [Syntrophobacteraceae bacterium]|jgi:ornithine carbamoyltransferase|nr:ornithine carbamoyltransferase [Syntrophobacteraceae bacterium]
MKRDLCTILDLTAEEALRLITRGRRMKREWTDGLLKPTLCGKVLGLIFTKPSTRTRVSFEAAMYRLGGHCITMTERDSQIGRKESHADTARVLSRYVDAIMIRTFRHEDVEELASFATVPVINGLTDRFHPCQVLSDLLTIQEKRGSLDDLCVAWVGDGNNVANSWINASARLGFTLRLACPTGYDPDSGSLERARAQGRGKIVLTTDPFEAVASADIIYTDVWASMGQESEEAERKSVFAPYQVNGKLLEAAPPHALVMHCLPAHRGDEITDEVMDGPGSIVFDQAENRLHLQMALIEWMMSPSAFESALGNA